MANSRHNKYVSVTDWFAKQSDNTDSQTNVPSSGNSYAGGFVGGASTGSGPSYWELRLDEKGNAYIWTKYHVATLYGVTMYRNDGSLDLPSIYRGLPIDKETLYWEQILDSEGNIIDEVLKARGGESSGGVADSVAWVNVYGKPTWLSDDKIDYSEVTGTPDLTVYALKTLIPSLSGYATEQWVVNKGYATTASIPSALKNPYALTFGSKTYDGSATKSITAGDLGAALSSDLSKYLPLSGGTINSNAEHPLDINSTSAATRSFMVFRHNSAAKAYVGYTVSNGTFLENAEVGGLLKITSAGLTFNNNKIWHAGNDGSGSGLDADLLDGLQPSELNVGSATKLQTPRTIWGQRFDGSGNVSGDLNGVGRIIRTEPTAVDMDFAGNFIFKNLNSTSANYWHIDTSDGTPIFVVHNNGNVGMGTTSPLSKCHIVHSNWDNGLILQRTASGAGTHIKFMDSASLLGFIGMNGTKSFEVNLSKDGSTNVNRLTINNTGTMSVNSDNAGVIVVKRIIANGGAFVDYHSNNASVRDWRVGSNSYGNFTFNSFSSNTETERITFTKSGNVGFGAPNPSAKLHVVGNILATGGLTMQSQRSLKNVVDERGLSLAELSTIKPTRYTWKDKRDDRIHFGGIADDIEKVLPEVIYKTSDGTLTMDYGNAGFAIASSLIKPVVDHETKIIDHELEIRMLKMEVKELKERLNRYEA